MKQLAALLAFTAILFQSHPAYSLFGVGDVVFDPSVWTEAATTVTNTFEMIKNGLQELRALIDFPIVGIAQDLLRLTVLLNRIKTMLPFDEGGVDALFTGMFGVLPCTEGAFTSWLAAGNSMMWKAHHAVWLAQTLINDIFELMNCITSIIDQVLRAVGNLQGLQTLGQIQSVIVHQQARVMAMLGVFHSAMSSGEIFRLAQIEAQRCIVQARLRDIPRVNVYGLQLSR